MVNTIPVFTQAVFGTQETGQIEQKLDAALLRWVRETTVQVRNPGDVTGALPDPLRDALRETARVGRRGFPAHGHLFAFVNRVGYTHAATGHYAKYLQTVTAELWVLVKLVIEFERLMRGETAVDFTVQQRALVLGAVGTLIRR